jgi:hypothetical protein
MRRCFTRRLAITSIKFFTVDLDCNLFVVKVLDNFNRRVRFPSERGYGGLVVEDLGISIPAAGFIASAYAFGAKRYAADAG